MLIGSFISGLLGTKFPGPGTIYMSQMMTFLKPVFLGDTITVVATVTKYRPEREVLTLSTECFNQDGVKVLTGEAVCKVTDVEQRVVVPLTKTNGHTRPEPLKRLRPGDELQTG